MQKKTRRFERTAASVCKEYAILTLATLVMSAGTYLFKFPNNFSFGGVTGLAVVLSAVSPLSAGTYNFIINMALLVLGFLFLGKGFGVKTVYISVLMSVALSAAEKLFPMSGPLTDQPVLELIFAIAIPGISSAIMFNMGASSGGTDIVAMILKKYTSMNIGTALLAVDLLIAVSACFVFDITTGLFSLCGLFTKPLSLIPPLKISTCANTSPLSAKTPRRSVTLSTQNWGEVRRCLLRREHTADRRNILY